MSGNSSTSGSWAAAWRAAALAFLASRIVVLLGIVPGAWALIGSDPARNKGLVVEAAMMWDAGWYWRVATLGYFTWTPETGSNLAFCPLYPALVRGLMGALDLLGIQAGPPPFGNFVLAGLLISNACFLSALVLLWRLVRGAYPAAVADRTLLLIAIFPTGLFWSAIYTESLFLLLVVGVFWFARQQRWAVSALLAGLAAITRWAGLLLAGVILVEYLFPPGAPAGSWRARLPGLPAVLRWLPLALVPFAAYVGWLGLRFGSPLVFLEAEQKGWQHSSSFFPLVWIDSLGLLINSWQTNGAGDEPVLHWGSGQRLYFYQDLVFSAGFAVLAGVAAWRRWLPPAEWAWLALGLIFPLSLGTTLAISRYLLPLWPAFVLLARVGVARPWLERGWLLASASLLAVTAYLWASGHWMA
ncbi:MAG TPA: mannosyltransferase family protein [Chloroflexia bacterium]|nr:mannosyltransferase family protein [Chloroflexia bacterium]